jgi:hypothetical protein
MKILRKCWQWFWRQSRLNKIVIVGLFAVAVPFFLPTVVAWFKPTMIKVGVAFYAYERAPLVDDSPRSYFFEKRNLVTNCRLRRVEQPPPKERAKAPNPQSWVVIKLLLENVSDQSITQLRMGVRSPVLSLTTHVLTAPNMEATGQMEPPANDARRMYAISIPAIPPLSSVVLSLKTPIDESLRRFIYENHRTVTIQVPFVSSDQFREYPPIVSRANAEKILNREGLLRTGEDTSGDEQILFTMLSPDEPDPKDDTTPYQPLPKSRPCSEGEAGIW